MSFWELLTLVGTGATIMGVSLAVYALINNRTLKEESRLTRESIKEESRLTRESIDKSIEESRRETRELIGKIDETLKYIADLIVSEGQKTRQSIENLSRL